jgi:hypothetical protein
MKTLQITCELDYQSSGDADYVFNIQAAHHPWQAIVSENIAVTPVAPFVFGLHPTGLNRLVKTRSGPGEFHVRYDAVVQVDYPAPSGFEEEMPISALPVEVIPYIWSSRYCESDAVLQVAARTFGQPPMDSFRRHPARAGDRHGAHRHRQGRRGHCVRDHIRRGEDATHESGRPGAGRAGAGVGCTEPRPGQE